MATTSACYGLSTHSIKSVLSLGIHIPVHACDRCRDEGFRQLEEAQLKGSFRYIQFINWLDKEYRRFGY